MKIHLLPILQFDTNLYRNAYTLMKNDAHCENLTKYFLQTEKDTRSDSSDETLSSTDDSYTSSNTPDKKNTARSNLENNATGNCVQNNTDHLLNNHEKSQ